MPHCQGLLNMRDLNVIKMIVFEKEWVFYQWLEHDLCAHVLFALKVTSKQFNYAK